MDSSISNDFYELGKKTEMNKTIEIEVPFNLLQYLSSENCDIQNLCRICLSVQQNMIGLFSSSKMALNYMLASISTIQAQLDDGLPSQICEKCKAQVISCYNFKTKCDKSDHTLKSLLKGEFPTKEYKSDPEEIKQEEDSEIHKEYVNETAVYLIENNDESEKKTGDLENIKGDNDFHEDIQYLETLSNGTDDDETLYFIQKQKSQRKNLDINSAKPYFENLSARKTKSCSDNLQACAYCSKRFKNKKALAAHLRKRHGSEEDCHPCKQCKEVFNSEHDLLLHSALHSKGSTWKCNRCSKEFKTRSMLRRHVSRHMESKRWSCERCGKAFAELYALRRHARVHTGEQRVKRHVCHVCDKRFGESSLLAEHMSSHSGEKPWPCGDCGKSFASARLLASHSAVHSARKPYKCDYCEARFRHESTRSTHHRTHTGEKPYVCATCGKTFIQNSNMRLHMRTHTGERPYGCTLCPRRFTSGSALKSHHRTHTNEKPYACCFCGKRFSNTNLTAHMRVHTGDKPFECKVCSKKFVTASRLRNHCRIHTGEKPFECTICPQTFSTKSYLRHHLKYHSDQKLKKKTVVLKDKKSEEDNKDIVQGQEVTNVIINSDEVPLEVTGELVVQDDSEVKTEILVVDSGQAVEFQNGNICLGGVTYVNNDVAYNSDGIDLVAVNEGGMSITSASAVLEPTTVKLYQIDQSLVQIHSTDGQVTISKITSKMTANF